MAPTWLLLGLAAAPATAITLARTGGRVGKPEAFRQEMANYKDMQYYGRVTIGEQTVNCVLDTGSLDFVVLSDNCSHGCGPRDKLFHPRKSTSYYTGNGSEVLSYGSGQLKAHEAYDKVGVGPLTLEKTCFWEIFEADMPLLLESDFQAIVGLGPLETHKSALFQDSDNDWDQRRSAILPRALEIDRFGICMGRKPGSSGWFTWNDDSIDMPSIGMTRLAIPWTGYWMVEIRDVRIGNVEIGCQEGCGAVVDSGTSLLAMPQDAAYLVDDTVAGLHWDCSDLAALPDIRFTLGEQRVPYSLPSDSYVGEVVGEAPSPVGKHFKRKKVSKCESTVMSIDMNVHQLGKVWILGVPFLRKYYTVFSQPSMKSPTAAVYTAMADSACKPAGRGAAQGLVGGRSPRQLRRIDATALRLPSWALGERNATLGPGPEHNNANLGRQFVEANGSSPPRLHH